MPSLVRDNGRRADLALPSPYLFSNISPHQSFSNHLFLRCPSHRLMKCFLPQILPEPVTGTSSCGEDFIRLGEYLATKKALKSSLYQGEQYHLVPQSPVQLILLPPIVLLSSYSTTPGTDDLFPSIDYCDHKMVLHFLLPQYLKLWQS